MPDANPTSRPQAAPTDPASPSLDAAVGSVAQEAALLLRAWRAHGESPGAGDRANAAEPGTSAPQDHAAGTHDARHEEHGRHEGHFEQDAAPYPSGSTCTWCPLCRTVDVVRTMSPETLERLADLAAVAATAVAELAVQARQGRGDQPSPPPTPPTPRRPAAQAVPVTDDPEEDA